MKGGPGVLVRVKRVREERALRELRRAREEVKRAQDALRSAEQELDEYRTWRPQQERRLYDEIQARMVKLGDLDDLHAEIAKLRGVEIDLVDAVAGAKNAADEATAVRVQAEAAYRHACAERQKMVSLAEDWEVREGQRLERLSDLELEEFQRVRTNPSEP